MNPLRKSVRVYLTLLSRVDLHQPMSREYRECLDYLRSLCRQYGQAVVRLEIDRQTERNAA